jgi:hypothetical protein
MMDIQYFLKRYIIAVTISDALVFRREHQALEIRCHSWMRSFLEVLYLLCYESIVPFYFLCFYGPCSGRPCLQKHGDSLTGSRE